MLPEPSSPYLQLLKNRVDLSEVPFTERGSRLLVLREPSGLSVRLAERWFKADPRLSAYRERPPLLQKFNFTDGDGNRLEFTPITYPHRVDFQTQVGLFSLTFSDAETLVIRLPKSACGITFLANVNQGQTDRRGGTLHVTGNIRRNIAYTTNRAIRRNEIGPDGENHLSVSIQVAEGEPSVMLLNLTPRLGFNRYIPNDQEIFAEAERRWHDWFAAAPPVAEPYRAQYYFAWWVMRAGLISSRFYTTREAMTPSKIYYVGVWQWDAYFHALAYRHVDRRLAQDQIRIIIDHQRSDGQLPDAVHDEGTITHLDFPVDADVTKPPLLAWAAWKYYETHLDKEFLDEIYEPAVRWNRWWFEYNDLDGDGLCEYHHPYSSGLDDSPLWDDGLPVTSPDLNTYLYMQMENLGRIAHVLGLEEESRHWNFMASRLLKRMNEKLWDPEAGLYWALHNGRPIRVRTPFSLFPLLTGALEPNVAERLLAHLTNPASFWPRYPVPSVALDDPQCSLTTMWRGPTWVNVNYLLMEGLERSGYRDVADELCRLTLDMISQRPDIYEYYNPQDGTPPPKAATTFGWSAALFIELAIRASRSLAAL